MAFIDSSSVNTGSNGLGRLDLAVQYAAKYGIKIIMTLTNNWDDLGGWSAALSILTLRHGDVRQAARLRHVLQHELLHLLGCDQRF